MATLVGVRRASPWGQWHRVAGGLPIPRQRHPLSPLVGRLELRSACTKHRNSNIYAQPRAKAQTFQRQSIRLLHGPANTKHRAFVALGSNMGDRVAMIEEACNLMESRGKIKIARTSSLWETKAMYVLDQSHFVNGACEVSFWISSCSFLSSNSCR